MDMMNCCEAKTPRQEPELDSLIKALRNQTRRYDMLLGGLINSLETPRPVGTCDEQVRPPCNSVQMALGEIIEDLGRSNELFEITLKRINEQVGDLKILP